MQTVSTAAQLFSATYAAAFRLSGEKDKADIVAIVNNWLDKPFYEPLYTLVDIWFLMINLIWYTFCLCIYRVFVKTVKNKFGLRAIKMHQIKI